MVREQESAATISEIRVEPQPDGVRAVYMVETRSEQERFEIGALFTDLEARLQVRRLSEGKLVSYVVQAHESDAALLDDIDGILRSSYAFVVTQRSFDSLIYRIIGELCEDTGSELLPVPGCNICGKAEPFPNTVVSLMGDGGLVLDARHYCSSCTARVGASSNKQFVKSLLQADEHDFGELGQAELERRPSHKYPIRFRIR